jgi:penicillin-binding protein 1C
VGNADGSGRTGLTGIEYAAPILFDIFNTLPKTYQWFPKPVNGYSDVSLCKTSGYKAGQYCDDTIRMQLPAAAALAPVCPFHHALAVNEEETYQVNASIYDWRKIKQKNYFVLPPNVVGYFKAWNPGFKLAPPWHPDISSVTNDLRIIYPNKSKILLFGTDTQMEIIFKAIHASSNGIIYWHIDNEYVGATSSIHEIKYTLSVGQHTISVLDQYGNQQQTTFEIVKPSS